MKISDRTEGKIMGKLCILTVLKKVQIIILLMEMILFVSSWKLNQGKMGDTEKKVWKIKRRIFIVNYNYFTSSLLKIVVLCYSEMF